MMFYSWHCLIKHGLSCSLPDIVQSQASPSKRYTSTLDSGHGSVLENFLSLTILRPWHVNSWHLALSYKRYILDIALSFKDLEPLMILNFMLQPRHCSTPYTISYSVSWQLQYPWHCSILDTICDKCSVSWLLQYPWHCFTLDTISYSVSWLLQYPRHCSILDTISDSIVYPDCCRTLEIALPLTLLVTVYPGYITVPLALLYPLQY